MLDDGVWVVGFVLFGVSMLLLAVDLGDQEEDANE